jgi:hypothetical protein
VTRDGERHHRLFALVKAYPASNDVRWRGVAHPSQSPSDAWVMPRTFVGPSARFGESDDATGNVGVLIGVIARADPMVAVGDFQLDAAA